MARKVLTDVAVRSLGVAARNEVNIVGSSIDSEHHLVDLRDDIVSSIHFDCWLPVHVLQRVVTLKIELVGANLQDMQNQSSMLYITR